MKTAPLTDYYEKQGSLRHIDGLGGLDEIQGRIRKAVGV